MAKTPADRQVKIRTVCLSFRSTYTKTIVTMSTITETKNVPKAVAPIVTSAYFIPTTKKITAQTPARRK